MPKLARDLPRDAGAVTWISFMLRTCFNLVLALQTSLSGEQVIRDVRCFYDELQAFTTSLLEQMTSTASKNRIKIR